ncbi:MAG: hypothetical protein SGBAC_008420 [Bacillariaceae sp.]
MSLSPERNSLEVPLINPACEMYDNTPEESFHDEIPNDQEDAMTDEGAGVTAPPESWFNPQQLSAMLSNFSTSYNVVNISLVLPILESLHSASEEAVASTGSSLLAGMMLGQVVGGVLGDTFLGALGALRLVMALQIVASIGSACIDVNNSEFYVDLATWRFILGIGAGGVYPLAAVLSAERGKDQQSDRHGSDEEVSAKQIHRVVLTFSTQGLGFVAVPILAVILFLCTDDLNFIWRFMLGFGCAPGLLLMLLQCKMYRQHHRNHEPVPLSEDMEGETSNDEELDLDVTTAQDSIAEESVEDVTQEPHGWAALLHEPGLGKKLVGTAGTWFLFDIVFYGNTIFQPIVMEAAFGTDSDGKSAFEGLSSTARQSLMLTSIALPGYFFAAMVIGKKTLCVTQTPRYVMMQGFAAMAILYAAIGMNWSYLRHYPTVLISLYGMTFFFANYGPNTTTFILPSLLYSPEHRSTWNGISAACGKLGALAGASLFAPAAEDLGDNVVMLLCAGLSVFAFLLTSCFVPKV